MAEANNIEFNTDNSNQADVHLLSTNIFHLYTPSQRRWFLLVAALIAFLTPFTDTIYLPALTSVADSFDANDTLVALTVSIYLACVGAGQLFWGPLSDHYGRTLILYIVLVLYEGLTIGCIFAESIATLIVLRSLQGLVVGSTIVSAQALIADVFPPDELGEATAAFMVSIVLSSCCCVLHLYCRVRCCLVPFSHLLLVESYLKVLVGAPLLSY